MTLLETAAANERGFLTLERHGEQQIQLPAAHVLRESAIFVEHQ